MLCLFGLCWWYGLFWYSDSIELCKNKTMKLGSFHIPRILDRRGDSKYMMKSECTDSLNASFDLFLHREWDPLSVMQNSIIKTCIIWKTDGFESLSQSTLILVQYYHDFQYTRVFGKTTCWFVLVFRQDKHKLRHKLALQ